MVLHAGLALACACGAPPLVGVGRSSDAPRIAPATSDGGSAVVSPTSDAIPGDYATRFPRVGADSFVAWGHAGGRYAGTLYASPEAKAAAASPTTELPPGAALVLATVDRASRRPGPTFFMTKGAKGWAFGVLPTTDTPPTKGDDLTLCGRCHGEAAHDGVFPVPD